MKIKAETPVTDIIDSHEKRIRQLELVLRVTLFLSVLKITGVLLKELVKKL